MSEIKRDKSLFEEAIEKYRKAAELLSDEHWTTRWAAVETLPVRLRSVLMLRTAEGLSYEQLADTLGISVGAVRSRLFRARQELLAALRRSRAADYLAAMYTGSEGDGGD